jgi:hypothetical protein
VRHCGLQKVVAGVAFRAMPLIPTRSGGLALVCINGCEAPKTTKGLADVVEQANTNKTAADHLNKDARNVIPLTGIPTTMRAVQGVRGIIAVAYTDTGVSVEGAAPNARQWKSIQAWLKHRQAEFDPSTGTPVLLYVCSVCGYTEMYHADTVDKANAPEDG